MTLSPLKSRCGVNGLGGRDGRGEEGGRLSVQTFSFLPSRPSHLQPASTSTSYSGIEQLVDGKRFTLLLPSRLNTTLRGEPGSDFASLSLLILHKLSFQIMSQQLTSRREARDFNFLLEDVILPILKEIRSWAEAEEIGPECREKREETRR